MAVPSMTLKFTLHDAERIMKASESLKKSLRRFRRVGADARRLHRGRRTNNDPPVPQRVVSTSDSESVASGTGDETKRLSPRSFHALLVEAADDCEDELIRAVVHELKHEEFNKQEICTSLLIFLDSNKKPKDSVCI
jgi:hypothetical protein